MNIVKELGTGAENAITGKELAEKLNCEIRVISRAIEAARRSGHPICAAVKGEKRGYYLAGTPEELEIYCNQLYHRGGELFKTRRALLLILSQLKQQREQEAAADE